MNYTEGQKVTIKSSEWYNESKAQNGFIVFKDGNKICTFSPGMEKFCGNTFTVARVVTGSSIYPDHYTFVEDGGSYKWGDEMIEGAADAGTQTYTPQAATEAPKPQTKPAAPAPKPAEAPKPQPKPAEQPKPAPKPVEQPKPAPKPVEQPKPAPKPAEQPKPAAPQPKTVSVEKEPEPVRPEPEATEEIDAFEDYTILLTPRKGAPLQNCAVQAYKILAANKVFPSVRFDFNGFEFDIRRKGQEA